MGSFFVILGISKLYLMLLRPHQQKAIQAMSRHNKGQVIVPTGGGKTMCMIQDAIEQFKSGRVKIYPRSQTQFFDASRARLQRLKSRRGFARSVQNQQ